MGNHLIDERIRSIRVLYTLPGKQLVERGRNVIFYIAFVAAGDSESETKRKRRGDNHRMFCPSTVKTIVVHVMEIGGENKFLRIALRLKEGRTPIKA